MVRPLIYKRVNMMSKLRHWWERMSNFDVDVTLDSL